MPEALRAAITGIGAAVPDKVITNKDLEKFLDTSDEWITQRTGIKERHIVSDGESTLTLAVAAAEKAIADAGITAGQLDMIICATVSPEMPFPATACFVQEALGAGHIPAFDISAACSGFVYALSIGNKFIASGAYKCVLVLGVDVLSRFADWTDRRSCILFGDAAGAVVLAAAEADKGILYDVLHADGSGWDFIHLPAGGTRRVSFSTRLKSAGWVAGRVQVAEDPLLADNGRWFAMFVPDETRLLIVGAPGESRSPTGRHCSGCLCWAGGAVRGDKYACPLRNGCGLP